MNIPRKPVVLILFFAFLFSLGIFRLLITLMLQSPQHVVQPEPSAGLRLICQIAAALALICCAAWTLYKVRASQNFSRFQTNVILSLALSEACTIFGLLLYFMGGTPGEFNYFMAGSIITDLVVILPAILKFSESSSERIL